MTSEQDIVADVQGAPWFCVYGHEHGDRDGAESCDQEWDQSWRGQVCPPHDAGLYWMGCICTPSPAS
jgi:hypothetical protein